jgi:acetyl-CoA carboxylase biotin carboxylase subunit
MRRALDEYAVGGIKTTLPFFRQLMRDEEFIAAKLDTGFIPRFFARQTPAADDAVQRDLAIIAAALAYEEKMRVPQSDNAAVESRWKMAGRAALHARL